MSRSKKPLYLITYRSIPYKKSRENVEIPEKIQKSQIPPLPAGRQGLWNDYTDFKWVQK
jgi:hypothetical protein